MIVVITLPEFIPDEVDAIVRLFDERGIDRLHIRKPGMGEDDVVALIQSIPQRYYDRITIHDHFALAVRYGLSGIHLTGRHPVAPADWHGMVSTSCHSIEELQRRLHEPFDYLSLSPVFDSISKQGYHAAFTASEIAQAKQQGLLGPKVLALGGVTFSRLSEVQTMGFGGGMILGDAWR